MAIGILTAAGVVGVILFALLLIFRRDLVGVDLSGRSLLRMYLFLASLAGVIVLALGVAATLTWGMASLFGMNAAYDRVPGMPEAELLAQKDQDLLRGLTLAVFGLLFWGGHRIGRGRLGDDGASVLRRAYDVLGTFVFGLATVILLPVGIYQALAVAILEPMANVFRQGFGDALAGGIVAVPIWLTYLLRVIRAVPAEKPSAIAGRPAPAAAH